MPIVAARECDFRVTDGGEGEYLHLSELGQSIVRAPTVSSTWHDQPVASTYSTMPPITINQMAQELLNGIRSHHTSYR